MIFYSFHENYRFVLKTKPAYSFLNRSYGVKGGGPMVSKYDISKAEVTTS